MLFIIDNQTVIKSGQPVIIHIAAIHKDPSHYPSPQEFIPERFTNEHVLHRHPYAFLPFSLGSRNCIGNKLSLL